MYTVIRFTAGPELHQKLVTIGEAMNAIRPKIYTGFRRRGDGFACDIFKGGDWDVHRREIQEFISTFNVSIKEAIQEGVSVVVDVAIKQQDMKDSYLVFVVHCDKDLTSALSSCGAALELSVYLP